MKLQSEEHHLSVFPRAIKDFFFFRLHEKRFVFASFFHLLLLFKCAEIGEFGAKTYFTDHLTAITIQLFIIIKGNFPGLFFF